VARATQSEIVGRQGDVTRGDGAVLVDVTGGTDGEVALAADDADHLRDLAAEDDAVGVAVTAAFAEAVETRLAHTAALELTLAGPRRHADEGLAFGAFRAIVVGDTGRQRGRRHGGRRQIAADVVHACQARRAVVVVVGV